MMEGANRAVVSSCVRIAVLRNHIEGSYKSLTPSITSSGAYQFIRIQIQEGVALVSLHRPEALNALCPKLVQELVEACKSLDNDVNVRALVITGTEKAFAAGADIKEMAKASVMEMAKPDNFITHLAEISKLRKPVIAAVNGYALGGGCELAMMCDIIIAGDKAIFGQPEIKIGTIPGAGGTQRLVRAVGKSKAMELILTGNFMKAQEAERAGLVSQVVPADKTIESALALAKKIAEMSVPSVIFAKECVNRAFESSLEDGILFERRVFHSTFATDDQKEGMDAFVNKRKPKWVDK